MTTWLPYVVAAVAAIGMSTTIDALITRYLFGRFRPFRGSKKRPPIPFEVRRAMLARARGRCEGRGERRRLEFHHVSYRRLGCEQETDLLAICRD
jgi:hypothetical protein